MGHLITSFVWGGVLVAWVLVVVQCVRVCVCQSLSRVQLFVTPWTTACQAPLSMRFPRQEYWSRLLVPSPGHLPDPGIKPASPTSALQADSSPPSH